MLHAREENHELRAPVVGIVLKGSVERSSNAPVKLGQPLFEVAQLHPLRLEIEVPATDYVHVRAGQSVEITLDGISDRTVLGTVEKIRPRSEIRDGHNVFVAEVIVENEDQQLRPGMRGHADIATASHPIGWNLFHKAWDALWRSDPAAFLAEKKVASPVDAPLQLAGRRRDDESSDLSRGATELHRRVAPRVAETEDPEATRN